MKKKAYFELKSEIRNPYFHKRAMVIYSQPKEYDPQLITANIIKYLQTKILQNFLKILFFFAGKEQFENKEKILIGTIDLKLLLLMHSVCR